MSKMMARPKIASGNNKAAAMLLIKEARNIEAGIDPNPKGKNPCVLLDAGANLCPHDDLLRQPERDTAELEVWNCPDCGVDVFDSKS